MPSEAVTTEYAICFDFPEGGDPWFAGIVGPLGQPVFGLVSNLANALKFESYYAAEAAFANAYGDGTRPHGAIVEVGR